MKAETEGTRRWPTEHTEYTEEHVVLEPVKAGTQEARNADQSFSVRASFHGFRFLN